jgi:hypothetical protein
MAVSGNGWPVSPDQTALGIETFTVGSGSFPVRGGKPLQALQYVVTQFHNRVEKVNSAYGCWGYSYRMNVNNPGSWSNHASGTAVDVNATLHPNGVSAAATFSAAQIAEIHQILAEVGGVVRWGGDYNGTPDAMHFEINASPEALDVAIDTNAIPDNGEIKPIGAPTLADPSKIPSLTENSVSYPTMMNYGHGYAQWKFDPQQTGTISIDALLSHYADPAVEAQNPLGPKINLYIFEIAYTAAGEIIPKYGTEVMAQSWPGDETHPARIAGQMSVSVVAGKHYIIRATCTPSYPWIRAVIRIGSFAKISDWITPPPVEAIVTINSQTMGSRNSLYFPSTLDSSGGNPDWIYGDGHPGWLVYRGMDEGPKFRGRYKISNGIFGRAPWARSAGTEAMECAWHWARRYQDEQDWTPGEGISWYGVPNDILSFPEHIYPADGKGSATCWLNTDIEQLYRRNYAVGAGASGSNEDYRVGVSYSASSPLTSWDGEAHRAALWGSMTNGSITWSVWAGSIVVDFDVLRHSAGVSGWGGAWTGGGYYGGSGRGYRPMYMPEELDGNYLTSPTVEWEDPETPAELVEVEWALDEYTGYSTSYVDGVYVDTHYFPTQYATMGVGSVCNWYVQKVQPAEEVEGWTTADWIKAGPHPYGAWGPWGDTHNGGTGGWYEKAVGDGPNEFVASCEHLTTTTGGISSPWRPLDPTYWSLANERLVDYDSYDGSGQLAEDWWRQRKPAIPAQARFVIMPRVMLSDAMPWTPPPGYGGDDENGSPGPGLTMDDYLQGQAIALRVTVQPGRYRIIYKPTIPNITYAGGPEINMNPENKGQVLY